MDGYPRFDKAFISKIVGARAARDVKDLPNGTGIEGVMDQKHLHAAVKAYMKAREKVDKKTIAPDFELNPYYYGN